MVRRSFYCFAALFVLLAVAGLPACSRLTPEQKVAMLRSYYEARLSSFLVQEKTVAMDAASAGTTGEDEASAAGAEPLAVVPPVPARPAVLLDIELRWDGRERLPGITLDISQAAAGGGEKATWRLWVDTSQLERGPGLQLTHVLEDVDYQDGDGFAVEVRHPIPVEELGQYREFAATP